MKKTIHFFLSTFILLTLLFGTQPASPAAASGPAPYLVKDINPYTALDDYFADNLTNVNGTLFFSANDGTNGWELWKSDGTFAGTVMVKDINPAGDSITANPNLTNVNGTLFFSANDGTNGKELWKSDGTAAGTVMVKDINPSGSSYPQAMFDNSGTLFFNASDDTHASELWKSDGTAAGTVMVKDINPTGDSSPSYLANVNGTLFFAANGTDGSELWKSDGTSGGTVLVKDINPGSADSFPNYLTNVNGTLFFEADDGTNGQELWKSDGTEVGTGMVKDINTSGDAYLSDLINVNGTLFFTAEDDGNMDDLWKSDGTSSGTVKLLNVETGAASVYGLTNVDGTLFFSAHNSLSATEGNELWRSDGTISGTQLVKDINPSGDSNPDYLININGALFFSADDGSHGRELWRSDGTTAGTLMVADNNPGSGDGAYDNYIMPVNINNTLFFIGSDGVTGNELWAYENLNIIRNTIKSSSIQDGWILESSETSGAGATMDSTATTFNLGDDLANKQYRAILHFDTSPLPDTAVITSATLKIKKYKQIGSNPFTILGGLRVDMRKPSFGTAVLALTDFKSAAGKGNVAIFGATPLNGWYSAVLNAAGDLYINPAGSTQFRIYFTTDDNNDFGNDYMRFHSGNAGAANQPQLVIEYYVP